MNEFSIYTIGDAGSYFHIFNSIAILMQDNYIAFAISMSTMIIMIRSGLHFSKAQVGAGVTSIAVMLGLFAAALYPSTTAHIIDVRQQGNNNTYTKIDHLPFALVFLASTVSKLFIPLAERTENGFAVIENSATNIGIGKQPDLLLKFIDIADFNSQENDYSMSFYKNAFKIYTKECAMSTSYIPNAGLDYFTKSNEDILEHISPTKLGIPTLAYTNTTFSDGIVSISKCTDLYDYLTTRKDSIMTKLEEKFKKVNPDLNFDTYKESIAKGLYNSGVKVESIDDTLGSYSENLKISMINYALSRTIEESIKDYKYDLPGVSNDLVNYSVETSNYQMKTDGLGNWAWVNKMAPMWIHYSLIFSYALFLFVIPIAMSLGYENSKKILTAYSMGVVSIHLGYITSVVANSIFLYYMKESGDELIFTLGNNLMSMNAIPSFNAHASEMAAISGLFLLSSYSVGAGIILYGETKAAAGIANTIGNRYRNNMLNAAEEMANKNAYDETERKIKEDANKFLDENGFSKPPIGVDEVAYANSLKKGLESMAGGYGFLSAKNSNSNFDSDYFSGVANKAAANSASISASGAEVNTEEAIASGIVQGNIDAGNTKGLAKYVDKARNILDGTMKQTMQKNAATASFGDNTSENVANSSGTVMGLQNSGKANALDQASKQMSTDNIKDATSTTSLAQLKDQIANANSLSDKFGKNLDHEYEKRSYEQMAKDESNMKLASRFGSAKGFSELGEDGFAMTSENADYMTRSKTLGTQKRLNTLGDIDKSIATDVANSLLKAMAEKLDLAAKKSAGILDSNNNLTSKGISALAIKPGEDAAAVMAKNDLASESNLKDLYSKIESKWKKDGLSNDEIYKKFAPFKDDQGNFKTGQDFWNTMAEQKAGMFASHNSIMFGDGTMFSGGFNRDGSLTGKFSSGLSSSIDDSQSITDLKSVTTGSKEDFYNNQKTGHNTDAKMQNQLDNTNGDLKEATKRTKIKDRVEYEASAKNQLSDAVTDVIDLAFGDEESQEKAATAAGAVGTTAGIGLGTYALEKATKDKQGNGIVKKSYNWAREKVSGLENSSSQYPFNESDNSTGNNSNSQSDNATNDKTRHSNPLKGRFGDIASHNESITKNLDIGKEAGRFAKAVPFAAAAYGAYEAYQGFQQNGIVGGLYSIADTMTFGGISSSVQTYNAIQSHWNDSNISPIAANAIQNNSQMFQTIDNPINSNIERGTTLASYAAEKTSVANNELIDLFSEVKKSIDNLNTKK